MERFRTPNGEAEEGDAIDWDAVRELLSVPIVSEDDLAVREKEKSNVMPPSESGDDDDSDGDRS